MVNALIILKGCPHCLIAKEAVILTNLSLPAADKVEIIDLDGGDPRAQAIMTEVYETDDRSQWGLPALVLQDEAVRRSFVGFEKATGGKVSLLGTFVFDRDHYMEMVYSIKGHKSWK